MTKKNLDPFWMPFTGNRAFKASPRMVVAADGHYYTTDDGRQVLDGFSGLWTTGAGHCHPKIVEAVRAQAGKLDYSAAFQLGHPQAFELADRVCGLAPEGFSNCFFTNSGSEAVDSALKIALAYHRIGGEGHRNRLIGRERGYHGVNFGGISVGGIAPNRKMFSTSLLPNVDHLPHTHNLEKQAFSKGQPQWGAHLASELNRLVALHDGSNIAAVIVEPVAGSTGILVPPVGYLQELRKICDQHGILLIFDEVITAFGRIGGAFASERFDVVPDIITCAKGLTNGFVPMGAVLIKEKIFERFMQGPPNAIELFHGYTYSGHPLACAAGLAAMDVFKEEGLFEQSRANEKMFEAALHSFKGMDGVVDVRNFGLMGAIELAPSEQPGERGYEVFTECFRQGVFIRNGMDTLQFSPFFDGDEDYYTQIFDTVRKVIGGSGK